MIPYFDYHVCEKCRGKHSIKLEAALPLWGFANISKR